MIKLLIFIIISEIWITAGQICFKKSADLLDLKATTLRAWMKDLLRVLLHSPVLIFGAVAMLAGLFFWLLALNSGDLSVVYSLRSMQFVFVLIGSYFFLGEKIDRMKLLGTICIAIGIYLVVIS